VSPLTGDREFESISLQRRVSCEPDLFRRYAHPARGLAQAGAASDRGAKPMTSGKIDTHQHFFPKPYVDGVGLDALARQMPNQKAPEWSPERAIAVMDAHGISEGILSVSSGPPIPDAPTLLRKCNDAAADLRQRYPGRFGSLASLPLPDIDASLSEVAYSLDTLEAEGFIIFASYGGKYLGDEHFAPLLEELNRRKTVAFIHPNDPAYTLPKLAPASVLEFPFETTRTATSLIISGTLRRFADIRHPCACGRHAALPGPEGVAVRFNDAGRGGAYRRRERSLCVLLLRYGAVGGCFDDLRPHAGRAPRPCAVRNRFPDGTGSRHHQLQSSAGGAFRRRILAARCLSTECGTVARPPRMSCCGNAFDHAVEALSQCFRPHPTGFERKPG
jgi:hypothetical protein